MRSLGSLLPPSPPQQLQPGSGSGGLQGRAPGFLPPAAALPRQQLGGMAKLRGSVRWAIPTCSSLSATAPGRPCHSRAQARDCREKWGYKTSDQRCMLFTPRFFPLTPGWVDQNTKAMAENYFYVPRSDKNPTSLPQPLLKTSSFTPLCSTAPPLPSYSPFLTHPAAGSSCHGGVSAPLQLVGTGSQAQLGAVAPTTAGFSPL